MVLQPLTQYGWKVSGELFTFDWDSDENMATVRQQVEGITKGCLYKTGCKTLWCNCKSENFVQLDVIVFCSNAEYSNTTTTHSPDTLMDVTVEENQDVDDIMDWIFGDTDNFAVEELDLSDLED